MKENTQEKRLVQTKENGIFYKIKKFFNNLFGKNKEETNSYTNIKENETVKENANNRDSFIESIRNNTTERSKILELQKQYRSGKIKEEELSEEQINSLCKLYDEQIAELRKSNEIRKQRILEYKRKIQTEN
mgnify:CR=1 FL=1